MDWLVELKTVSRNKIFVLAQTTGQVRAKINMSYNMSFWVDQSWKLLKLVKSFCAFPL